ncbi:hypothetical protein M422DRAFT_198361 [Sphaerobolus stellatus SS14]|nr:hypothetical protein M422DRAFT_198361 [Sphaerobolus stellatus SS14]
MTQLYRHLRIHQVFGANTDVGKTIFTTALCRASSARGKRVFYLKPVSTGAPADADDGHLERFGGKYSANIQTDCLFRYSEPLSPHLAVQWDNKEIIGDDRLVSSVADHIRKCAASQSHPAVMYVETAGGVHSPVISGNTQVNAYRSLFLPTILVGDPKLGGISSTISAFESLLIRGYRIDAVTMFSDNYYGNHEYLKQHFAEQDIPFFSVPQPPARFEDPKQDFAATDKYYSSISDGTDSLFGTVYQIDKQLDDTHTRRIEELESMPRRTLDSIWWPFVQHGLVKNESDVMVIDSAHGDFFSTFNSKALESRSLLAPQLDGSASWWTQALGHSNPSITLAAAKAAGRYGHVMFPQASHEPALKLAERLIKDGPGAGWASRAFFSDNGSTGIEVALKMAFRAVSKRDGWKKGIDPELGVLGLKGSYHGDTIGAMDACEEGVYTCEWHNSKGYWLESPEVGIKDGTVLITLPSSMKSGFVTDTLEFDSLAAVYDLEERLKTSLASYYRNFITDALSRLKASGNPKLAALVLEPLVMGAGGMIFVDPLFQRVLVDTVRGTHNPTEWQGMPVIFDEVFVGLYRLGLKTTSTVLGVHPDIAVYAKILTGGLVPMSITLANDSIYQSFLGNTKVEALLHGHSYTAHAVGCEVSLEALSQLEKLSQGSQDWKEAKRKWHAESDDAASSKNNVWSFWEPTFITNLGLHPKVEEVMTIGTVLAFKIKDDVKGYGSASAQKSLELLQDPFSSKLPFSVHYRTLGNVGYFICSLNSPSQTLRDLEKSILLALQ